MKIRFHAQWNIYENYEAHIDSWLRKFEWLKVLPSIRLGSYFTFSDDCKPFDTSLVIMKEKEATRESQLDWFQRMTQNVRRNAKKCLILIFSNQSSDITLRRKLLYERSIPKLSVEYFPLEEWLPRRTEDLFSLLNSIARFVFEFRDTDGSRDSMGQKYFLRVDIVERLQNQLPEIQLALKTEQKIDEFFYHKLISSQLKNILHELGIDIISLKKSISGKSIEEIVEIFPKVENFVEKIIEENLLKYMLRLKKFKLYVKNVIVMLAFMLKKYLTRVSHKCCSCYKDSDAYCCKCKLAYYCSQTHQRLDWKGHKPYCDVYVSLESLIDEF